LPAFSGITVATTASMLLAVQLYRELGARSMLVGGAVLVAAGLARMILRLRRSVLRRRGGHYTSAELARLDDQQLTLATARMLRRDGWQVFDLSLRGRARLYAFDHTGRELDVTLRPVALSMAEDEPIGWAVPLGYTGRAGLDNILRVIVQMGTFRHEDVLRASHQGGVYLLDSTQLQRWAAGATLDELFWLARADCGPA